MYCITIVSAKTYKKALSYLRLPMLNNTSLNEIHIYSVQYLRSLLLMKNDHIITIHNIEMHRRPPYSCPSPTATSKNLHLLFLILAVYTTAAFRNTHTAEFIIFQLYLHLCSFKTANVLKYNIPLSLTILFPHL